MVSRSPAQSPDKPNRRPPDEPPGAETTYRALFERAADAIVVVDEAHRFVEVNPAACALLGAVADEIVGRPFADFLGAEGASGRPEPVLDFQDRDARRGDLNLRRADGRTGVIEFSATRQFVPGHHLIILRDATERRVAERIRRDAEWELKSVLDNVDAIISRFDRESRFIYTNEAMKRLTGVAPHTLIGKRLDDLPFPKGEIAEWNENLRTVFATGQTLFVETFTVTNPVGQQYFESSLTPEFGPDGRVVTVLSISRNVSKGKAIEQAQHRLDAELKKTAADLSFSREELRHQTALFHLIVDQMAEGLALADHEGRIIYMNRAARQIFPMDRLAIEKWSAAAFGLYLPDQSTLFPTEQLPLYRALQGESVDNVEIFARIPDDGQTFWLQVSARPVVDESGRLRCAVAVLRDVTAAREVERKLAQVVADVQRKAEQLERSNNDLEQFAYVASHDLKEPLRMVTSYVQLLERRYRAGLDDDARQFIDFAVDGARRMYTLLDELLRYYRAGKHERSLVAVESSELVNQVIHELTPWINESGATITHGALPRVLGDPPQLRQLFYNLMENALKFRGPQTPRVEVESRRLEGEWQFTVRDNGVGIETGQPDRVFAIFQRLHRRDQLAGTGIGLAICRRIVNRHGGRIWFESKPGQGTAFHFTLPAVN